MGSTLVAPSLITITIEVPQITEVLSLYDRIKVYRATSETGAFAEITTATSRIVMEADVVSYDYLDATGSATHWYKVSYLNTDTGSESALTDAFLGERDPALDILSVDQLKSRYFFGLNLTDDAGNELSEDTMAFYIKHAIQWLEDLLDIKIAKETITDEPQDFYYPDYQTYIWTQLNHVPVIDITELKMTLPNQQDVITYDSSWLYERKAAGQVQVIPGSGQMSIVTLGLSGAWLPFAYGRTKHIPNIFVATYTAGFERGCVPADIQHAVGMVASFGPLNLLGDIVIGAGIANTSLSIDGLSQSVGTTSSAENAAYSARIRSYREELKMMLPQLRRTYHPVSLAVV